MTKPATLALLFGSLINMPAFAAQQISHTGKVPQLIELYTSEGCHSCPPADQFLAAQLSSDELWKTRIPMAFHVDYWDYIGWKDPFAQPRYTQRQKMHFQQRHISNIYTPGWVVDHQEWKGFFRRTALPAPPTRLAGKLTAQLNDNGDIQVRFDDPKYKNKSLTAHMAWIGFDKESDITAGENSGKKLQHQFVVLHKQQISSDDSTWSFQQPTLEKQQLALAVWLTPRDQSNVIQAAADWLAE